MFYDLKTIGKVSSVFDDRPEPFEGWGCINQTNKNVLFFNLYIIIITKKRNIWHKKLHLFSNGLNAAVELLAQKGFFCKTNVLQRVKINGAIRI